MANKFLLKSDRDWLATYWRRGLLGFAIGLVLIFAGQSYFLWSVTSAWQDGESTVSGGEASVSDRVAVSRLFSELESRPERLAATLATSTLLVDPSR